MGFLNPLFQLFAGVLTGFYALVPSLGLAIILLTVAVRLVLLPLSIKQTRSMREMQRIGPETQKLKQKYKGDRQKMNEELMKLYKEHGVNPLGGCGPLLLQFPVLIGLFYVVRGPLQYMGYVAGEAASNGLVPYTARRGVSGLEGLLQGSDLATALLNRALEVHSFLGLRLDCTSGLALGGEGTPTVAQVCGNGLLDALPYLVMVLLMGATTFYQQKQMQATQSASPQAAQMQTITRVMPVLLMVFAFNFPAGVVLYWLTTNVWTIAQQRYVLRKVPHEPSPAKGGDNGSKRPAGKLAPTKPPAKPGATRSPSAKGTKSTAAAGASARPANKKKRKR